MIRKNQEKIGSGANLLKIGIFLVAILFLIGQVNAEIGVWCEGPNEDEVTVCKSIYPNVIRPEDGTGTAKITLNVSWPVETIPIPTPADVVLAIDSSGSMKQNDPNGLRKAASKRFIDVMKEKKEAKKIYLVGLVSWDYGIYGIDISEPLTNEFDFIKGKIDEVDDEGFTDLNLALRESIKLLDNSPRKTILDIDRVIILLTDGKQETPEGEGPIPIDPSIIEKAKKGGYKIDTIGLGPKTNINESLLKWIAIETGGEYIYAENASVLIPIYEELAKNVTTKLIIKIGDITITDILHNYIEPKEGTFTTLPVRIIQNPDGTTTIKWEGIDPKAEKWETSFDVIFDFSNLPIDVNQTYRTQTHRTDDISVVNYTVERVPEPEHKSLDIPSGNILINCPTIPPSSSLPPDDFAILVPTSISLSPPNPAEGQKTTIIATIQNIGRKNSGSFAVRFIADGNLIGEAHVEKGLESGEATTVETDWTAKKGVDITAKVDITSTSGSTQTPVKKPTPCFETIFAIAALLAVAYLVLRRRKA